MTPPNTSLTERRSVALSSSDVYTISNYARAHGLTTSEYIRMRATTDPIERMS